MGSSRTRFVTVPLDDIRVALESRVKLLERLEKEIADAVGSTTGETRAHNEKELGRVNQKLAKLKQSTTELMGACCPNQMDCEHEIILE